MKQVTMQDMFEYSRHAWLEECRSIAKRLLRNTENITIEDVTKVCPRPTYLHPNVTGSVFNQEFRPVGFTIAKRAEAKGRIIRQWRLK